MYQPGIVGGGYNVVTRDSDMFYTSQGSRDF